ncbi:MAG TPA: hypothetical protein VHB79_13875 [Polyangiaceae bacterium]|nr:hypothetical protein [Polyangiaceae bacterium]
MPLFSASGGLVYHLRAWRRARALWQPFRAEMARWLQQRLPATGELVLVGPSAGHCLPLAHLAAFERVTLLEPDPVARFILRRRLLEQHHHLRVDVEARDFLLAPLLNGTAGLDALLDERPRATVLFCNVLGQLHFELTEARHERFGEAFRERIVPRLATRAWASFHDRWSLDWKANAGEPPSLRFAARPGDEELGQGLFGAAGPPVTVLDHGTAELFPAELPRRYVSWRITPRALHVVEALPAP